MSAVDRSAVADDTFEVEVLSAEEGRELFDRQARRWFGISGDEFVRRYRAGEYLDNDSDPGVRDLEMLLGFYCDAAEADG